MLALRATAALTPPTIRLVYTYLKTCKSCGRENTDAAARCQECGAEFGASPPKPQSPPPWDRVATIESEVEAERLDLDLNNRDIPHVVVSHSDAAFDGLFQATRGWGHVEAPAEHREAILTVLKDLRESRSSSPDAEPEQQS